MTTATKERKVEFAAHEVQNALRNGGGQFRRVMKPQPPDEWAPEWYGMMQPCVDGEPIEPGPRDRWGVCGFQGEWGAMSPHGGPGDRLWVRETFSLHHSIHYSHRTSQNVSGLLYRASWPKETDHYDRPFTGERRWRSPIHMPRWASRLTLEITSVRAERLQAIMPSDVVAEGFGRYDESAGAYFGFRPDGERRGEIMGAFVQGWDSINAKRGYPWESDPWVWVYGFKVVERATA